jgi:hypothetical protein
VKEYCLAYILGVFLLSLQHPFENMWNIGIVNYSTLQQYSPKHYNFTSFDVLFRREHYVFMILFKTKINDCISCVSAL